MELIRLRRPVTSPLGISLLLLCIATVSLAPARAVTSGNTISYGDLYSVNPESGNYTLVNPIGDVGRVRALTFEPMSGLLYGTTSPGVGEAQLFWTDPETGGMTVVGGLGAAPPAALAFGDDGTLWLGTGADLWEVDPTTASSQYLATVGGNILALASRDGRLIAFVEGGTVIEIDPVSGNSWPLFSLPDLFGQVRDAAFDGHGHLRFLVLENGGPLNLIPVAFYQVADLDTGVVDLTWNSGYGFTEPIAEISSLAFRRPAGPIAIPTLGSQGVLLSIVTLLLAAIWRIRRAISAADIIS